MEHLTAAGPERVGTPAPGGPASPSSEWSACWPGSACWCSSRRSRSSDGIGTVRTLSPRVVPYFVAGFCSSSPSLLALDIARGGRGEQESGEDVDLSHGTEWRTLLGLAALVAARGQLIPLIGFPAAGALLFFGTHPAARLAAASSSTSW